MRVKTRDIPGTVYRNSPIVDAEGNQVPSWTVHAYVVGDVQAIPGGSASLSYYGLTPNESRRVFTDFKDEWPVGGIVDIDGRTWEIVESAMWQGHCEVILKVYHGSI